MAELHVIKGISEGRSFDIDRAIMFIGRSPENDIQIKDPSISRRHAEITKRGERIFIKDLNSQNGTWICGNQIEPGYESEVADGSPIAIGKVILSLNEGGADSGMIAQGSINMPGNAEDIMGSVFAAIHDIIQQHGGVIKVSSEKGTGTKFNIYMPEDEKRVTRKPSTCRSGSKAYKRIETILVVDDDKEMIKLYREMLERLGYRVLLSECGKHAVEIIKNAAESGCEPDLVILDMIMPGMGGKAVFDEIKNIKPDIKVLIASGYSLNGHLTGILNQGCNDYIQKPFTITEMSAKIDEIEMQYFPVEKNV